MLLTGGVLGFNFLLSTLSLCLVYHEATAEGNNLTALSAAKDFYKREMSEVKCYTIYSHVQASLMFSCL